MIHQLKLRLRGLSQRSHWFSKIYRIASASKTDFKKGMTDEEFLKERFRENTGKLLDLDNPKTFNEKLQWLKLYDRNPLYNTMVDKYAVRKYIADQIGEKYLIPLYGVWGRFDDIDFSTLPNEFVLKCTHDSGSVILCKDKDTLDIENARKNLSASLKRNYYYTGREWPYKNVIPRIIAEKFMIDESGIGLRDYKYFCFNGAPKFLYVGQGLTSDHSLKIDFYDLEWKKTPFYRSDYKSLGDVPRPSRFSEMVEIACQLSKGIPFVRVDLYCIDNRVFFSEFTFFPAGGYLPFVPDSWDSRIGSWVDLSLAFGSVYKNSTK